MQGRVCQVGGGATSAAEARGQGPGFSCGDRGVGVTTMGEFPKKAPRAFFSTKSSCSSLLLLTSAQPLTQPNFPTSLEAVRVRVCHRPTLLPSPGITRLPNFSGVHRLMGEHCLCASPISSLFPPVTSRRQVCPGATLSSLFM